MMLAGKLMGRGLWDTKVGMDYVILEVKIVCKCAKYRKNWVISRGILAKDIKLPRINNTIHAIANE